MVGIDGRSDFPSDNCLRQIALREIERHKTRRRHLPAEFFSDAGWLILLDLFVRGEASGGLAVEGNAGTWGISEALAARMIVTLIECSLAQWVGDERSANYRIVRLTELGSDRLRAVLALHQ